MIPGNYDITVYRGGTYKNRITAVSKDSGLTTDFTKYTAIRMQVRPPWIFTIGDDRPSALLELNLINGKITKANANQALDILIPASETAALSFSNGLYDIELVVETPGMEDEVDKILQGTFTVMGEVTTSGEVAPIPTETDMLANAVWAIDVLAGTSSTVISDPWSEIVIDLVAGTGVTGVIVVSSQDSTWAVTVDLIAGTISSIGTALPIVNTNLKEYIPLPNGVGYEQVVIFVDAGDLVITSGGSVIAILLGYGVVPDSSILTLGTTDANKILNAVAYTVPIIPVFAFDVLVTSGFVLPLEYKGTYNFTVDWGDGSSNSITTYDDPATTHSYVTGGTYLVSITGQIDGWAFNNGGSIYNIKDVKSWGGLKILGDSAFQGCGNMTVSAIDSMDTSLATSLDLMFQGCSSLTDIDLSGFNTSLVKDMANMFDGCTSLTSLDLSSFDTSLVTDMYYMFSDCSSLTSLNVSSFNTSLVRDMNQMFQNCASLTVLDVSSFNTSLVTDMGRVFHNCSSLVSLDVSTFNTSLATNMKNMFNNCSSLKTINLGGTFNTSLVTNMQALFYNCTSLTAIDLSTFDTSLVTDMAFMFQGLTSLYDMTGVENLSVISATTLSGFLSGVTLPTERYSNLLINFADQVVNPSLTFDGGLSKYNSTATTARADLIANDLWSIADGGLEV